MIEINRKTKEGVPYVVKCYPEAEAKQAGIQYVYWKDFTKETDLDKVWALSDDGWVVPVQKCNIYRRTDKRGIEHVKVYLKTGVGPYFINDTAVFDFNLRMEKRNFSDLKVETYQEKELKLARTRRAAKVYARQLFHKGQKGIDWEAIGKAYRPTEQIPEASAKRLFRQTKVMEMVDEEVKKIMEESGMDKNFVMGLYKKAVDVAQAKMDAGNLLKAADRLADYLGISPDNKAKIETTQTMQLSSTTTNLLDGFEEANQIKLTKKVTEDATLEYLTEKADEIQK